MKLILPFAATLLVSGLSFPAYSQGLKLPGATDSNSQVDVKLIADTTAVSPGSTFTIGMLYKIEPEWHIYYKSPGGVGFPTAMTPKLPTGFSIGDVQYPTPIVFESPGEIISYGYDKEVLLSAVITAPKDLSGDSINIETTSRWLMCKDRCIPKMNNKNTLTLAVGKGQPDNTAVFNKYKSQLPVKVAQIPSNITIKNSAEGKTSKFHLTIKPASGSQITATGKKSAYFFPFESKEYVISQSVVEGKKSDKETFEGDVKITVTAEPKSESSAPLREISGVLLYEEQTNGKPTSLHQYELSKKF